MGTAVGEVLRKYVRKVLAIRRRKGITYAVEASDVGGRVEGDRRLVVDVEQLLQVEDLDVVVVGLAADNDVVLEHTDLAPDGGGGTLGLGKTAEVSELATLDDL